VSAPPIALLGDPAYYRRFGFRPGTGYLITPPRPQWQLHFQVRFLAGYQPGCAACSPTPNPSTAPDTR
jgi:putative acetyltransferase